MKLIAIILSGYLLGLTFLPCNDTQVEVNNDNLANNIVILQAGDSGLDHSHSAASDLCPPFCTCHCCHVHTIDFGTISFQPLSPEISITHTPYFDNIGNKVLRNLLQPPRV